MSETDGTGAGRAIGCEPAPDREALCRAARAAWPGVEIAEERFLAYLSERLGERTDRLSENRAAEIYLACACASGDAAAIAALERRYFGSIQAKLASMGLGEAARDEILQRLRHSLLVADRDKPPGITDYTGHGALGAFLHTVAVHLALNRLRDERLQIPVEEDDLERLPATSDAELEHVKREHRGAFKGAFLQAMRSLTARQQNLIRQHFLDGLTLDEIGALYQVHRVTAARWIAAARHQLRSRTKAHLLRQVRMSPSECDSLMRILQSQFETTVRQCLTPAAAGAGSGAGPDKDT